MPPAEGKPTGAVHRGRHVPELDGLRAIAILAVMLYHARNIGDPGAAVHEQLLYRVTEAGWIGVDLFFVLSGFLITGILLDTRDDKNYFRSFFARRALRILPLYYAVLAVILLGVRLGAVAGSRDAAPYYWAYLQNWLHLDGDLYRVKLLSHFWSLAIEEQFYLVWPWLIWLLPRRWIPALCVAFIAGAFALRFGLTYGLGLDAEVSYYLTPTRMDTLALGGLLAAIVRSPRGMEILRKVWPAVLALAAGAIVVIAAITGRFQHEAPAVVLYGFSAVALGFGAFLSAAVTTSPLGRFRTALRHPWLAWIGKVSYGAYVFHWPVMALLAKAWPRHRLGYVTNQVAWWGVTLPLTFLCAGVSYRIFESRFLRLKDRFSTRSRA